MFVRVITVASDKIPNIDVMIIFDGLAGLISIILFLIVVSVEFIV